MGRPPGAPVGSGRRRPLRPQEWELRESARPYGERLEELDSEEDDGQGVILDANGYATMDGRQRGFAGDELYFTGHDIGQHRRGSYQGAHMEDPYSDGEGYDQAAAAAYYGREEALAQSAYERIAKARANGKTTVNLSTEEMDVLERRRGVQQPAPRPPPQQVASPPATPPSKSKGKPSSRNNSSASLSSQKGRKKSNSNVFSPSTPPSAKQNSKAKVSRKPSGEQASPYVPSNQSPGILVPGPNGQPMYAPIGYYPPPSPELSRVQPSSSRARSRSTSKHKRRESTPPEPIYAQYPPRYFPPPAGMRPPSSGSNRSLQDEMDWYPPPSRHRSASNAQQYRVPDDYAGVPMPAAQGRRNFSGPQDVSYSTLRRVPPASSPLAARPGALGMHHYSDPAIAARKGSGLSQEVESGSNGSSSDDQGVQVEIVPEGGRGYAVNRTPAKEHEARRRKVRR